MCIYLVSVETQASGFGKASTPSVTTFSALITVTTTHSVAFRSNLVWVGGYGTAFDLKATDWVVTQEQEGEGEKEEEEEAKTEEATEETEGEEEEG